jgi:Trypsin
MKNLLEQQQSRLHPSHSHRNLIVGGHDILPGRYPYFVSIDKNNGVVVNGALIAPDIVLTAGHIGLNHMDNITLKVGPYAVHSTDETVTAETIPVAQWLVPSTWSQLENVYFTDDFLIIKLSWPSSHAPVKVNADPTVPVPGQPVVMTGLGWLNEFILSPAEIVQEVELLAISNDECNAAADPTRGMSYLNKIDDSMVCTKAPPNTTRDGWYV